MKKHVKWFIPVLLLLLIIVLCFWKWNHSNVAPQKNGSENKTTTLPKANTNTATEKLNNLDDPTYNVKIPDKAYAFLIRNQRVRLYSNDQLSITTGTFEDKIPPDVRFILVPDFIELTTQEKTQLQQWVKEKKMVLFFGTNVDAKNVLSILNVDKEAVKIQANATLYQAVYGYGYSLGYKENVPLFLFVNTTDNTQLASNISRFIYEKRGF
ncbi:hypothetical protein CN918_26255 [Priestia megaterium]|nr:hypothetical protein CN918_26255 [Priestia megaterium]